MSTINNSSNQSFFNDIVTPPTPYLEPTFVSDSGLFSEDVEMDNLLMQFTNNPSEKNSLNLLNYSKSFLEKYIHNGMPFDALKSWICKFSEHSEQNNGIADEIFCNCITTALSQLNNSEQVDLFVKDMLYICGKDPSLYKSSLHMDKIPKVLSNYTNEFVFLCASDSRYFVKISNKNNDFLQELSPGTITNFPTEILKDVQLYVNNPQSIAPEKIPILLRFFNWASSEKDLNDLIQRISNILDSRDVMKAIDLLKNWRVGGFDERLGSSIQSRLLKFLSVPHEIQVAARQMNLSDVNLCQCFRNLNQLPLDVEFFNQENLGVFFPKIQTALSLTFTELVTTTYSEVILDRFGSLSERFPELEHLVTSFVSYEDSVTDDDLEGIFQLFPNLEYIDLQSYEIKSIPSNINPNLKECRLIDSDNLSDISSLANTSISKLYLCRLVSLEEFPDGPWEDLKELTIEDLESEIDISFLQERNVKISIFP